MNATAKEIPRITGLLVIEVRNSNPNGDPDRESDPRTRAHDGKGNISDVSFKRKLRELVLEKKGPVWTELRKLLCLTESDDSRFGVHVDQNTRNKIGNLPYEARVAELKKCWDVRVFGSTDLEKKEKETDKKSYIKTGVAQFSVGVSVAKVRIQRDTNTVKANVDKDKDADRGMAPLGFRVVEHGVYAMPFLVNPTAAHQSETQLEDIELLCRLIPYAYPHNASRIRPLVEVRHAWYFEHKSPLGSCSDFAVLDSLTPTKSDPNEPSTAWADYDYNGDELLARLRQDKRFEGKYKNFGDLCDSSFVEEVFPRTHG